MDSFPVDLSLFSGEPIGIDSPAFPESSMGDDEDQVTVGSADETLDNDDEISNGGLNEVTMNEDDEHTACSDDASVSNDAANELESDLNWASVGSDEDFSDFRFWEELTDEEKEEERKKDEALEAELDWLMRENNNAETVVSPVQLVSEGGIRVIKFTAGSEFEDSGWYSDRFLASAGEQYRYTWLFEQLGEVRFLIHLFHAIHLGRGDINYAGLFNTFGEFRFNNIRKALKNGAITILDTLPVDESSCRNWQYDLKVWMQYNQLMTESSEWNLRWQQDVNAIINANQFTVPAEVFRRAAIDTFTVNYRDMLINVGGASFNTMCRTEAFSYMLGATGMYSNRKPVGVSVQVHTQVANCAVVVKSSRPRVERLTSDDPYLQLYWYFEDLREEYVASEHKDINRFTGYEASYAKCFKQTRCDGGKIEGECKICGSLLGPAKKINFAPHLQTTHPLVFGVVSVNMYKDKVEMAGEEIDYPKQVKKEVLESYQNVLF